MPAKATGRRKRGAAMPAAAQALTKSEAAVTSERSSAEVAEHDDVIIIALSDAFEAPEPHAQARPMKTKAGPRMHRSSTEEENDVW